MNDYRDDHLNYWSDVWVAAKLGEAGITLDQFLHEPQRYIGDDNSPDQFRPLLPRQRAIAEQLERQAERGVEHLPRRNGAIIEPLHHKVFPRGASPFFMPRAKSEEPQS